MLLEVLKEREGRCDKILFLVEEAGMSAEMGSVLGVTNNDVLVSDRLLDINTLEVDQRIVLAVVEQGRLLDPVEIVSATIVLVVVFVRLLTLHLPVHFLLKLMSSADVVNDILQVHVVLLLVDRSEVVNVLPEHLLEALSEAFVDHATPGILQI